MQVAHLLMIRLGPSCRGVLNCILPCNIEQRSYRLDLVVAKIGCLVSELGANKIHVDHKLFGNAINMNLKHLHVGKKAQIDLLWITTIHPDLDFLRPIILQG